MAADYTRAVRRTLTAALLAAALAATVLAQDFGFRGFGYRGRFQIDPNTRYDGRFTVIVDDFKVRGGGFGRFGGSGGWDI